MLKVQSSFIYSIEGKDIILAGSDGYKTKKGKKFKGALDYSLLALKINELDDKAFYMGTKKKEQDKQYTKTIINLTFDYAVKSYNPDYIDKNKVYIKFGIDTKGLEFTNGVSIHNVNEVQAVIVDKWIDIVEGELLDIIQDELLEASGFTFQIKKNKIKWTANTSKFETIMDAKKIRQEIYLKGFTLNSSVRYLRFIRSTGSSRQGKCLFVREDLLQPLNNWLYMGLEFKETDMIDELPALEAYIALVTSSIIDTIEIKPENILVIDDYKSIFNDKVMETKIINGRLVTDINQNMEIHNNIWDGQSILDASVMGICQDNNMYWVNGKYADKGFLLLRNRFFKSACFSVNVQMFFADNNITDISQLKGITLATDISQIKLITTKSSIKYSKFSNILDWLNKVEPVFGVVKYEKPTHYFDGDLVQTHYQLLNTLQLNKDFIKELVKPSFKYLKLLKNDVDILRYHLRCQVNNNIKTGDINNSNDMLYTMLQVNNEFYDTEFVDNFKQDIIDSYISNIRQGHILAPGTYSVLFGSPFSMLLQSVGKFTGQSEIEKNTIVCKHFEQGKELVLTRSPHVTMGNVMVATINNEYNWMKYFNLSKNIVCINSICENTLQRLQSADFDSDTVALIDIPNTLLKAAKKNYDKFVVPTTSIDGSKNPMYNNLICKAELDIKTNSDLIGRIVNCSQIGNSILWHKLNNGASFEEIESLYKDICTLSVASGLAIDSAKKNFDCDLEKELDCISAKFKSIMHNMFDTNDNVRPMFFRYVADKEYVEQSNYKFINFDTSMDYLQQCINQGLKDISNRGGRCKKGNVIVSLAKLINKNDDIKISQANRDQIDTLIIPKITKYKSDSDFIWKNEALTSEQKYEQYKALKNEVEAEFKNIKISIYTMKKIINDVADGKYQNIARKLFSMIYTADRESFIRLFRKNRDNICELFRAEDGDIDLYGIKFKKIPTHFACKH